MNYSQDIDSRQLQVKLEAIAGDIHAVANSHQGNSLLLLALLRTLEKIHRDIRDNYFQASLPDNRQELYALLKDIEEAGGWPYIERMKLRGLLDNMSVDDSVSTAGRSNEN